MANSFQIFKNQQFQSIAISHFNTILGTSLLVPVLPVFLHNSGFSETQIGIIMGATAMSSLIIRPWIGFQVDTKGSRPVILLGQIVLILSTVGYWWATSFLGFFVLRFLYGIGQAFYGTGAVTFASSIGSGESNSNSIAMYTLTTMCGLGLSMSMAQVAFDNFGFYALVGISVILIGIAFNVMKWRSQPIQLAARNVVRAPFMDVLKSNVVCATTLSQFAASFAFSAALTFIPLASIDKGVDFYSLFFIAFAISVIFSRVFVQKIGHILGLLNATLYASITMLLGIVLLLITISPMILVLSGLLFGLGFGVVYPTLVLLLVERIQQTNRGTALGIMIAAGDIGTALSAAILGGVAEHLGYFVLFSATALLLAICTYYFYSILVRSDDKISDN
ncbi:MULTISPECIES: MFS transporter [Pelosinus]|uniref:Major facilitator superfamily MFS_1 n=1 Tax=Pelosinus fermentans B4 TaxID=1149862 RepID=I9LJM6_9FIRM|nr:MULTISPECIES: MFS transporter [Pelosinus]EIW20626.1 major facilitator superfamily MFS_1 [Pelosinus fermentans B4]EIW25659.1 major facilitator superfamily MFS_1 [Pelosinus fermentans A11]OAM93382.1 major facilitator superfamily MFS_1 [Pelosinus fermentans DSM 17108]SDQ75836.1 Predicted arabinose efflux permease, MFS family [Pelosinus fermentans]